MGFLLPVSDGSCELKPPFDIAGDLDTPVSAFMKLGAFAPRFLLESVEGGERLARYSFIGFGDGLEVRLDARRPRGSAASACRCRRTATSCSRRCARALRAAPQPAAGHRRRAAGRRAGRLFGLRRGALLRAPAARRAARDSGVPALHYVAPRSLLVFDHLTRGIALLHAGAEDERRVAAQGSDAGAARRAAQRPRAPGATRRRTPAYARADYLAGVRRTQEYIAAGDVYQLVLSSALRGPARARSLPGVSRAAPHQSLSLHVLLRARRCDGGRLLARGAGEAERRPRAAAADRRHAAARRRRRGRCGARGGAAAPIRRRMPSTSCWSIWRATTSAASRTPAACASSPTARSSATATSCTSSAACTGELAPGRDAFDLFAAAFPAGTLVGAPKVRAMQIIDELEPVSRGLYGGTVGYFGARGDMDQAITIRTLVFRGDEYSYQAGAGIVADSVPQTEYEEVLAKSGAMARALELAEERPVNAAPAADRQLRLLHLQPGAGVPGAGRGGAACTATTRSPSSRRARWRPTHLCISPGPGTPYDAGVSMDMIRAFAGRIPVFGVCLGHQSIVEVFGGKVVRAGRLMHGKTSLVDARRPHAVRRPAAAVRGGPLPLADRRARRRCRRSSR